MEINIIWHYTDTSILENGKLSNSVSEKIAETIEKYLETETIADGIIVKVGPSEYDTSGNPNNKKKRRKPKQ